jgi:hypothetical protein
MTFRSAESDLLQGPTANDEQNAEDQKSDSQESGPPRSSRTRWTPSIWWSISPFTMLKMPQPVRTSPKWKLQFGDRRSCRQAVIAAWKLPDKNPPATGHGGTLPSHALAQTRPLCAASTHRALLERAVAVLENGLRRPSLAVPSRSARICQTEDEVEVKSRQSVPSRSESLRLRPRRRLAAQNQSR